MIYIIISSSFPYEISRNIEFEHCKKDEEILKLLKNQSEVIIKIGYTNDDPEISSSRFSAYKTENITRLIYAKIPNGDMIDEYCIHKYFEKLRVDKIKSREWFKYDYSILKFFDENNTIEKIRKIVGKYKKSFNKTKQKNLSENIYKPYLTQLFFLIYKTKSKLIRNYDWIDNTVQLILNDYKIETEEEMKSWIKDNYGQNILDEIIYNKENVIDMYDILLNKDKNDESQKFVHFIKKWKNEERDSSKLRYLCTDVYKYILNSDYDTKEVLNFIVEHGDYKIRYYYSIFSPEIIRQFNYIPKRLDEEIKFFNLDNKDLDNSINQTFTVDNNYSWEEIKNKLTIIYKKFNIEKEPNHGDLFKYFELQIVHEGIDPRGFNVWGYRILRKFKYN